MRLINADNLLFELANESFPQSVPYGQGRNSVIESIKNAPTIDAVPVQHEDDGTLWVTVEDCEKVDRVIIKNEQGHFCRVFYMGDGDEEPVVRCGDCMFCQMELYEGADEPWCDVHSTTVDVENFCSWGKERR